MTSAFQAELDAFGDDDDQATPDPLAALTERARAGEKITPSMVAKARAASDLAVIQAAVEHEDAVRERERRMRAAEQGAHDAVATYNAEKDRILASALQEQRDLHERTVRALDALVPAVNVARRELTESGYPDGQAFLFLPPLGSIGGPEAKLAMWSTAQSLAGTLAQRR